MFSASSRPSRVLICLCLALALLASGCTAVGSTRPVVKIGLVAPFEGLHRALGYEVLYAVKLAIRQYDAVGGQGGPLVELVALDDTQDPFHAAEQARELTLDPNVVGVVGHLSRATTVSALPEYHRAGVALVIPVAMPGRLRDDDNSGATDGSNSVVRLVAEEEAEGAIAARFAVGVLKARRLVVVGGDDDTLGRAFATEAEAWGADVRPATWADEGLISALVQDTPDAIFFAGNPVAGAEFLLQARGAGVVAPVVGSSAWGDPVLTRLARDAVGRTFYVAPFLGPNSTPAGRRFVEDYIAYTGQSPSRQAALAYDATRLLLDAIAGASEDGATPTREAVARRLSEIRVFSGTAGAYRFDDKGERVQGPLPVVIAVAERRAMSARAGPFDYAQGRPESSASK